jgi:Protein of unknown function (DUF2442)
MNKLPHVTAVEPLDGYRLRVTFSDGVVGDVNLGPELWGPMFEPLKDPECFAQAFVDCDTVTWPNGADLAPEWLYDAVTAQHATG